MKKLHRVFVALIIIVFSFVKSNNSNAQNLVDNWSFEDTLNCPWTLGQIDKSAGWITYEGSPDYFNSCNQSGGSGPFNVGTPQNTIDFQNAKSGVAYSGLVTYSTLAPNGREFMGTKLNQIMQIGQKYYVSFYISRAVNHTPNFNVDVANNKIGLQFSTYPETAPNTASPNNFSQVYTDSIITDTLNWIQVKGSFVADSNYQYVGIGNYFDGANTSFIQYGSINTIAYYYFDDLCISVDSLFCDQLSGIIEYNDPNYIKISPNPARDWIIIRGNEIKSLKFYDVSGRQSLSFCQIITPFRVDISQLNSGIYFLITETKNGQYFNKLFIHH